MESRTQVSFPITPTTLQDNRGPPMRRGCLLIEAPLG